MDNYQLLLIAGAGLAFYLQISWLFFALAILFIALVGAQYYTNSPSHMMAQEAAQMPAEAGAANVQLHPPIVIPPRQSAEDIKVSMYSNMMAQVMAQDALAARSTPGPLDGFTIRQYKWRQGPMPGSDDYYDQTFRKRPEEKLMEKMLEMEKHNFEATDALIQRLDKDKKKGGH